MLMSAIPKWNPAYAPIRSGKELKETSIYIRTAYLFDAWLSIQWFLDIEKFKCQ